MKKIQNTMKIGILLLGVLFILTSCEKEELIEENKNSNSHFNFKEASLDEFKELNEPLKQIEKNLPLSKSSEINNFLKVDKNYVLKISNETNISYTMRLLKSNLECTNCFQNLVISNPKSERITAKIYTYYPDEEFLKNRINNPHITFSGKFSIKIININKIKDIGTKSNFDPDCNRVAVTMCSYEYDHVAQNSCYDGDHLYTLWIQVCDSSGGGGDVMDFPNGSGNAGDIFGGDGTNAGDVSDNPDGLDDMTSPLYPALDDLPFDLYLQTIKDNNQWILENGIIKNREALRYKGIIYYSNGDTQYLLNNNSQLLVSQSPRLINGTSNSIIATSEDNGPYYYFYNENVSSDWYEVSVDNKSDCLSCDLEYLIGKVLTTSLKLTGRYVIPIEDALIIIDGKDFDGEEANQYIAGGMLIFAIVPGGKIVKPLAKTIKNSTTALQIVIKEGGEFVIESVGKAVNVEIKAVPIDDFVKYVSETGEEMARIANNFFTISKHKIKPKDGSVIFRNADDVNAIMKSKGYDDPPFKDAVTEFISKENEQFVRFHNSSNPDRSWMMKLSDVENFTNLDQVRNAFSLNSDNFIDKVSFFNVPAGKKIYAGKANSLYGFDGNGFQFFIDENIEISWRIKELNLTDFFK